MKTKNIFKLLFFFFGTLIFFSACTNELDVTPKDDDEFLSEDFYSDKDYLIFHKIFYIFIL